MTILINEGIEFNIKNLTASVENDFSNATDLADYLVAGVSQNGLSSCWRNC